MTQVSFVQPHNNSCLNPKQHAKIFKGIMSKESDSNWFGINGHNHNDSTRIRFISTRISISLLWNRTQILISKSSVPWKYMLFLIIKNTVVMWCVLIWSDLMFSLVVMPFNRCCSILKLRQNCTEFIISAAQKSNFVKLIFYVTSLSIFLPFLSSLSLKDFIFFVNIEFLNFTGKG